MNPPDPELAAAELKAMQNDIYRKKILRAHRQTPEQRLADVFDLTNSVFTRMHKGAMVQELRWGRSKDFDDARDVLAVQGPETLDMAYIEHWCGLHGTLNRPLEALAGIPPLD
jgi:hypothetical protein